MSEENELIIVYSGNSIVTGFLKSILEAEGIKAFLKDEIMGTTAPAYAAPGGVGAVKIVIARRDIDKAKPIIERFVEEETERK